MTILCFGFCFVELSIARRLRWSLKLDQDKPNDRQGLVPVKTG